MKRLMTLALGCAVFAAPLHAALKTGVQAPDFTTQATLAGMPFKFSLADALKKGPVVLYFYPAAFTPGCTIEAHEFAEATDKFKALGATVIGTVGDDEKAALAKKNGCDHAINYRREDFVARVNEITSGKKCPVVYDSVGKDTFYKSLDCIAPLGLMALFGQSSGAVAPVDLGILAGKGSLFVTRPTLNTYTATREDLLTASGELFDVVQNGAVKLAINQTYKLRDAAQAHRDLEGRKTTGSTVLVP